MLGNSFSCSLDELQPVISQTQPVHLYLTAGSPRWIIAGDSNAGAGTFSTILEASRRPCEDQCGISFLIILGPHTSKHLIQYCSHAHQMVILVPIESRMVGSHFEHTIQLLIFKGHLYLSDGVVRHGSKNGYQKVKTCVQSRLDYVRACSKFVNHYICKFNCQFEHSWGDLYDNLIRRRI